MKLKEFIENNRITQIELAEMLGVHASAICHYVNGKRIPEPDIMRAIKNLTNGQVSANDFYE